MEGWNPTVGGGREAGPSQSLEPEGTSLLGVKKKEVSGLPVAGLSTTVG